MGTRGFISFNVDGDLKTAYNHFDSYPDGLGLAVLRYLRAVTAAGAMPEIREKARALRVVDGETKPTPEEIEQLRPYSDEGVSRQTLDDWYCLLRRTQGNPGLILEAGVIEDASEFPGDSLFAEWGYVIDFDNDGRLEAYRGFQRQRHSAGRFADMKPRDAVPGVDGYFPVTLLASWPLAELPSDQDFLAALAEGEEEE